MADCSYARCVQERRYIRRELAKWTKNMVHIVVASRGGGGLIEQQSKLKPHHFHHHIHHTPMHQLHQSPTVPDMHPIESTSDKMDNVGLERVAEELMGRRKWKHYQDVLTRQQLNLLDPSTTNSTEDDLLTGATGVATAAVAAAAAAAAAQLQQGQLMSSASATAAATALSLAGGGMIDQKTSPAAIVAAANAAAVASLTTPAAAQAAANTTAATAIVRNGHCQQDDVDVDPKIAASASPDSHRATNCLTSEKLSPSSARSPRHGKDDRAASPVSRYCHANDNGTATPTAGGVTEGTTPTPASPFADTIERDLARPKSTSGTEQDAFGRSKSNTPDRRRAASVASPDVRGEQTATEHESMSIVKQEPIENADTSSIKSEQPNPEVAIVPKLPIVGTNNNIINSNNNTIQHRSNGMAIKDGSSGTKPLAAETPAEPEAETPVDWKPQDKCYFCVDGKLLTVNETGELVPENGPGPTEGERFLNRRAAAAAAALAESDSDTSESSEPELLASLLSAGAAGGMSAKSLVALLREAGVSQNLPSLQPFVAQYTAAASLQGLQPNIAQLYNPALWYSQLQQQLSPTTVETAAGGAAATVTLSPTTAVKMAAQLGTVGGTGEQPLDLSAKPGTSGMTSLLSSMMDPKHMYKAKPRLSPIGGRKTYTEDGLQNALQDILSGRLGTRRAAMQYGIPRSTLRNKVYKMALGVKRGIPSLLEDDDDKDSQDGDIKDSDLLDKLPPHVLADMLMKMYGGSGTPRSHENNLTPTPPATATPPAQHATPEPATLDIAGMSLKSHPSSQPIAHVPPGTRQSVSTTATPPSTTQPPQSSPLVAAAASTLLNPNLVMQVERILQVTATAQASGETQQALAELPELLRKIIDQQQLLADQIKKASGSGSTPTASTIQPSVIGSTGPRPTIHGLPSSGNGSLGNSSALDAALARSPSLSAALNANGAGSQAAGIDPCYLPFLQQLQQQQGKLRTMSTGTPDTPASMYSIELNDVGSDDPHVILKIPSYGRASGASPGVGGVPASSKNGDLERHLHHHNLATPSPPTAAAAAVLSSLVGTPARAPHVSASPQAGLLNSAGSGGTGIGGGPSVPTSSQVSLASSLSSSSPLSSLSVASSIAQQERASLGGSTQANHLSVISPPLMNLRGAGKGESALSPPASGHGSAAAAMTSSGKPMLSVHEVIARSISKNFQQHQQSDIMHKQQMDQMKRPSISVIKTLGDISHFGSAAVAAAGLGSVGSAAQLAAAAAAAAANSTGTGGKGTRPKRGKYRNYDRDSLVEAVKAVQRGEMSVHRAGSYYGVPHSTLEYKVKERHLMRPRKREPKPQPGLDDHRLGGSSSAKGSADGSSSLRGLDKGKGGLGLGAGSKGTAAGMAGHSGKNHHHLQQQVQQAQQAQFSNNSPNGALGAKIPMFDASAMGYGASFFWPHAPGFTGMPGVDFSRSQSTTDVFSSPALMQRFQQEATASSLSPADPRHFPAGKMGAAGVGVTNANLPALPKGSSVREMAEQLYDGSGANGGSFLDDIIRQSLDKKSGDLANHSALFDHLLKGKLRSSAVAAGSIGTAEDASTAALLTKAATKRAATSPPMAFHPESIKRERASPSASSTSSTGSSNNRLGVNLGNDQQHHGQGLQQQNPSQSATGINTPEQMLAKNVESLMKLHENLSSMSAAHLQRTAMEELNGTQGSTGGASRPSLLGHQSDSVDLHGSDGDTDTDSLRSLGNHHGHSLRHSLQHQQQQHHHHQRGLTDDSS